MRQDDPTPATLRTKATTQKDIAKYCGVHVSTVSLALRNDQRLPQETIDKIQQAAMTLAYDPAYYSAARQLVLGQHQHTNEKKHIIGLLFPHYFLKAKYFSDINRGVVTVLTEAGYGILTFCVNFHELPYQRHAFPSAITDGQVDALVAFGHIKGIQPFVEHLRQVPGFADRPILIIQSDPPKGCLSVRTDDEPGMSAAISHLLSLGHRHVLLMGFHGHSSMDTYPAKRIAVVKEALTNASLNPEKHLHLLQTPSSWLAPVTNDVRDNTPEHTIENKHTEYLLREYLDTHREITAILAVNDSSAHRLWQLMETMGRRVPDDISIIGFDDTDPVFDEQNNNLLASVRIPLESLGEEAGRLIIEQLNEPSLETMHSTIPTEFVVRRSICERHIIK